MYYKFDEDIIVSECCSKERMKDSKKLTHAAIVVNNFDTNMPVSFTLVSKLFKLGFRRIIDMFEKSCQLAGPDQIIVDYYL